jgi:hypothetical protein
MTCTKGKNFAKKLNNYKISLRSLVWKNQEDDKLAVSRARVYNVLISTFPHVAGQFAGLIGF